MDERLALEAKSCGLRPARNFARRSLFDLPCSDNTYA